MEISFVFGGLCRVLIPSLLCAVVAVADDQASSDADSGEYFQLENCIRTAQIRSTDIIDDRTIVFYMSHQKIFVNQLPRRCSGLRIADAFSYRTTISQLCNVDVIRVVRTFGRRLDTGPSCGLGKFRPATEEEVAMLKNKEAEEPAQEPESQEEPGESNSGDSDTGEAGDDQP